MKARVKGRVVFEGRFVAGQNSKVAVFEELASSASLMSAWKMIVITGCQEDSTMQESGAQEACTQSELQGTATWFSSQ